MALLHLAKGRAKGRFGILAGMACLLASGVLGFATDPSDEQEQPPPQKPGVRLQFVPPPMEGTLSMGIYDRSGKLVRILHREADTDEFTVALNGLITSWDGKDDKGAQMPPGTYFARGYMVGEFNAEGDSYEGNDWVEDENTPHVQKLQRIIALPSGVRVLGQDIEGKPVSLECDDDGEKTTVAAADAPEPANKPSVIVKEGAVYLSNGSEERLNLEGVTNPLCATMGQEGTIWVIDRPSPGTTEIEAFDSKKQFIRRLAITPSEPQPFQIAAAPNRATIFLLEANDAEQRVRALRQVAKAEAAPATSGTSTWEVAFSKSIIPSSTFDSVKSRLKFPNGTPFVPQDKVHVNLLPNPLEQDKPGTADVRVGFDESGSYLQLADGLPLAKLTDTPHLKWAVINREPVGKALILFQSDGAVVEGYRIYRIANMMAFDCGDFTLGK